MQQNIVVCHDKYNVNVIDVFHAFLDEKYTFAAYI